MTKLIYTHDLFGTGEEFRLRTNNNKTTKEPETMVINVRAAPGTVKWIDDYIMRTRRFKSRSEFISFAVSKQIEFILEYEGFVEYVADDKTKKKVSQ
jgi:Arc/MetJ-type ribon-helix-helix transcriptional regulator